MENFFAGKEHTKTTRQKRESRGGRKGAGKRSREPPDQQTVRDVRQHDHGEKREGPGDQKAAETRAGHRPLEVVV